MDVSITLTNAAAPLYPAPAKPVATDPAAYSAPRPAAPVPQPAEQAVFDDSARVAAVREAALSFKNVYALGDTKFSIFKDAAGKYITRYVSLRDGSVTYLPEPTMVKHLQSAGHPAFVAIQA